MVPVSVGEKMNVLFVHRCCQLSPLRLPSILGIPTAMLTSHPAPCFQIRLAKTPFILLSISAFMSSDCVGQQHERASLRPKLPSLHQHAALEVE